MKKLIVIQDNDVNDGLGEAFDIVGNEEFECVRKLHPNKIKEQTKKITSETKWIIIEDTRTLMYAWQWYKNGFITDEGVKIEVNVIFIEQYDS